MARIGLVAHDDKKDELVAWAIAHRDTLAKHELWGTGTSGGRVNAGTGLKVSLLKSGPLGGDAQLAQRFDDGYFATLYLSPKDYHRIHMPCDGRLTRMIYVPGDLFSVNPATAQGVPGLFARNERVICHFDMPVDGRTVPFVLVLVGATIVGSMATAWHGVVNPPRPGAVREWRYDDQDIRLDRGAEMGRFLLGSTVVMLWPHDTIAFNPHWAPAAPVRLGDAMGEVA